MGGRPVIFSPEKTSRAMKAERARRGWDQAALSRATGYSISAISGLEALHTPRPPFPLLLTIAEALDLNVYDFCEEEGNTE
jgi:transcriptional regulator with XRE-family HTH domain